MKHVRMPALLTALSTAAAGCGGTPATIDRDAEVAAITTAIEGSIRWCFPDKSRERLHEHLAKDSSFFMFKPSSTGTIIGHDQFVRYAEEVFFDPRFTPVSSDIRDLHISLSRGGDAAWFSCFLDDRGIWDGQPVAWLNARWTGVLEERDGKWLLVQQHFSLPTDAEEAESAADSASGQT